MPTPTAAQYTPFSKDVLGRYVCNGLDEALALGNDDSGVFHEASISLTRTSA